MTDLYQPYRIDILLSNECNLSCKNCITNNLIYSNVDNSIKKLIDFAIDSIKTNENIYIHFTGGEPFLQIDKIKEIINRIKKKELDFKIKYSVYSNLTILNNKIIETIRENDIKIHSSIDGLKEENDKIRGEKTFENIINNIKKLKTEEITINSITTTLKNNNYKKISKEFVELLVKLKIKIWRLNIDYYGIDTKPEIIINIVFNLYKEALKNNINVEGTWLYPFNNLISDNKNGFCPATRGNVISILPNGKINLCPYSKTYIGTNENSFQELEQNYQILKQKHEKFTNKNCQKCIIKDYCQTQCMITQEQNDSKLLNWYCKIYQNLTIKLLNFHTQN